MRAERDKRARILTAEATRSQVTLEAEGLRHAQILKAEGEAEAIKLVAEAEAQAVQKIKNSIVDTAADPIQYLIAVKYIDALKEMVSGKETKVVYMPYEASGILGSLGGIKELFHSAKG